MYMLLNYGDEHEELSSSRVGTGLIGICFFDLMQKNKAHVFSLHSLGCAYILPTEGYPGLLAQHTQILTQDLVSIRTSSKE